MGLKVVAWAAALCLGAVRAGEITVVSWNSWNFNNGPDWPNRSVLIAEGVNQTAASVVVLLEIRNSSSVDMYEDMKALLPQYQSWWRAVMTYTPQRFPEYTEVTSEGTAIFWLPGVVSNNVTSRDIPFPAGCAPPDYTGCDANQRAVSWVKAQTSASGGTPIDLNIFTVHVSTSASDQQSNAAFISGWLRNLSGTARPRVLIGDFNSFHDGNQGVAQYYPGFVNATTNLNCTYHCGHEDGVVRDGMLVPDDSTAYAYSWNCRLIGTAFVESDHRGLVCSINVISLTQPSATPTASPSPTAQTSGPSASGVTLTPTPAPSVTPTTAPSPATVAPTGGGTASPSVGSEAPTAMPTVAPTGAPGNTTGQPTPQAVPSVPPTSAPSPPPAVAVTPTATPTLDPTAATAPTTFAPTASPAGLSTDPPTAVGASGTPTPVQSTPPTGSPSTPGGTVSPTTVTTGSPVGTATPTPTPSTSTTSASPTMSTTPWPTAPPAPSTTPSPTAPLPTMGSNRASGDHAPPQTTGIVVTVVAVLLVGGLFGWRYFGSKRKQAQGNDAEDKGGGGRNLRVQLNPTYNEPMIQHDYSPYRESDQAGLLAGTSSCEA